MTSHEQQKLDKYALDYREFRNTRGLFDFAWPKEFEAYKEALVNEHCQGCPALDHKNRQVDPCPATNEDDRALRVLAPDGCGHRKVLNGHIGGWHTGRLHYERVRADQYTFKKLGTLYFDSGYYDPQHYPAHQHTEEDLDWLATQGAFNAKYVIFFNLLQKNMNANEFFALVKQSDTVK